MLEPALQEQVGYLHRELDRQRKRVTEMNYKVDEVVGALNAVQEFIAMIRLKTKDGLTAEITQFQPKIIQDGGEEKR